MKTKDQLRTEAEERQAARDKRRPADQILLIQSRPGESMKEMARLRHQMELDDKVAAKRAAKREAA